MMKLALIAVLFLSFNGFAEEAQDSELEDKALIQATESMVTQPSTDKKDSSHNDENKDENSLSTKEGNDDSLNNRKESQIPAFREAQAKTQKPQSMWGRLVMSFIVVAAVAGGLIVASRRWAKTKNIIGSQAKVKIAHQLHLGPKKSIALIEVAGEHLLIGVTDHNINLLKTLSIINDEIPDQVHQNFEDALGEDFQFSSNFDARMN